MFLEHVKENSNSDKFALVVTAKTGTVRGGTSFRLLWSDNYVFMYVARYNLMQPCHKLIFSAEI
jgi:hypothetical protein